MSGDDNDVANGTQQQEEESDMPKFNLYIRASLIDNETQGACPISQLGFMLSYLLAQESNVDFKVWTVSQVNPPKDFTDKNQAKIYPFVEGISGKDKNGQSIAGLMPESTYDVENFFDSVNFDCPNLIRPKILKDHILGKVDDIATKLNGYLKGLKPESAVTSTLQKIENHLQQSGTTFLEGEKLSYTDCFLLPKLQHLIVAGKFYKNYEIPHTLKNVWRYLRDAYDTPAFKETLPTDEDICKYHWTRLPDSVIADMRKQGYKGAFGVDQVLHKSCTIPAEVASMLDSSASNGDNEDEDMDGEEPAQQEVE